MAEKNKIILNMWERKTFSEFTSQ